MERLTKYICDRAHGAEGVSAEKLTGAYCRGKFEATALVGRLASIEDILGNDYDLDRLRELVELTKNIPHVCRFCVGCEMEPKDGHGCDEYDSFVCSTRRLRELMEADRDGRCIVLPCKVGDELFYSDGEWIGKETVEKIVIDIETDGGIYAPRDIGYSVYKSAEEAEAVLKEDQHGQDL